MTELLLIADILSTGRRNHVTSILCINHGNRQQQPGSKSCLSLFLHKPFPLPLLKYTEMEYFCYFCRTRYTVEEMILQAHFQCKWLSEFQVAPANKTINLQTTVRLVFSYNIFIWFEIH